MVEHLSKAHIKKRNVEGRGRKRKPVKGEKLRAKTREPNPLDLTRGNLLAESTIGEQVTLLTDSRLSHSISAEQRAHVLGQLQGNYGNAWVQRVVEGFQASSDGEAEEDSLEETVQDLEQQEGSGHPIEGETRRQMEESLGYDLGQVRLHTDGVAHRAAESLGAKAFTMGTDIFFNERHGGALSSSEGKGLLAHELTHVVQPEEEEDQMLQAKAATKRIQRQAEEKGEEAIEDIAGKKREGISLNSRKSDTNTIAPSSNARFIHKLTQEPLPDEDATLRTDRPLSLLTNPEQKAETATQLQQQYGNRHVQPIYRGVINSISSKYREEPIQEYYPSSGLEIDGDTGVGPDTVPRRSSTQALSEKQTYVQRNEKPTAGLTLEAQGNKVKVEVLGEFPVGEPIKLKYATYKVFVDFGGSFEVEFPGGPEPQPGESPPPTKELKPIAKEAALKYAKRVWEKKKGTLGSVESIDFVSGIGGKRGGEEVGGGHGGESGFAVGIKIKLAGNIELSGVLNVIKLAEPKSSKGTPVPFEIQGPSLEGGGKIELPAVNNHPWGGYRLTGSGVFGLRIIAEPSYGEIALELMKKYAPQLLQRLGMTALQAMRNIMASGPALIGFLGAYITVKATLATLEDWSDEKRVVQAANQACAGFRTGFMTGLGVEMSAGDPAWYAHGAEQARAALMAQVKKIQDHPLFKPFNFTELELIEAMKSGIRGTPGPFMKLAQENEPRIKALYIQQWRQNLTWAQKTFTSTESAERRIKYMLGLDIDEPLPEVAEPPPAEPVEPVQSSA